MMKSEASRGIVIIVDIVMVFRYDFSLRMSSAKAPFESIL